MAERESQLVLGLDPDPRALWPAPSAGQDAELARAATPAQAAAAAVRAHCRALIDATAPACVAVKLQLARFELLGAAGRAALGAVAAHARAAGLLVIADGKRGDIDVTAQAYAASLFGGVETPFGHVEGLGADLVTVNPLMGADAIEPFVRGRARTGRGRAGARAHLQPRRGRRRGPAAGRRRARCGSGSRRSSTSSGARAWGRAGSATWARWSARPSRGTWRAPAS